MILSFNNSTFLLLILPISAISNKRTDIHTGSALLAISVAKKVKLKNKLVDDSVALIVITFDTFQWRTL